MEAAATVEEMIEDALAAARDYAGLPGGARWSSPPDAGRGTPGATNLIMVRHIP